MKRLYLQVYLTIIASLIIVVLAAGLMWRLAARASPAESAFDFASELASAVVPAATEPRAAQQQAIDKFAQSMKTDLALYDAKRNLIASAGEPLPPPRDWRESGGWMHVRGGHAWSIALADGRWIVMRAPRHRPGGLHPALRLVGFLGIIAVGVAAGAYPIVRRLTRRIERLDAGVVSLGQGDLATRVPVEGRDEVATLATNFNRAAERIEALVGAHKMLLANASHELRTPLARIKLGVELLKSKWDPAREAALAGDIAELDTLIDEILLSSRLDAIGALDSREDVDLLGLAAEECARFGSVALEGQQISISGDPRLLRRMIRNLIENAERHGRPPVEARVERRGDNAVISVADHGSGIAAEELERVFQPFHRSRTDAAGTGLGLALVRQIARRHGGEAGCENLDGNGIRFYVTMPLHG